MQFSMPICSILLSILIACKTTSNSELASKDRSKNSAKPDYSNAKNLSLNTEYIPAEEELYFQQISKDFLKVHRDQTKKMKTTHARRGMHVKDHGCFEADFVVLDNKDNLRHGVFAEPKTYKAVVRFSNGSGVEQVDYERDLRGFAVKIYDSGLPPLLENMEQGAQDFLMTNAPKHHANDIVELMEFIEASHRGGAAKVAFLASHIRLTKTLLSQTGRDIGSLLNESYFSRAAFRLGNEQAMRFETTPCSNVKAVKTEADHYLTADLQKNLGPGKKACFKFAVRIQTDPKLEPIEDHSTEWQSNPQKVGVIYIYGDKRLEKSDCEALRFNPWNAHAEHQPLGNFNRARLHIYNVAWDYRK